MGKTQAPKPPTTLTTRHNQHPASLRADSVLGRAGISTKERSVLHVIRQKITVQAGGRIELCAPELAEGTQAEVIVIEEVAPPVRSLVELIGQGRGAYATPEAADAFLRGARDAWD